MKQAENVGHITLWSLFWIFLKIGCTAFGGFMALISVVQNYIVERRKLLSQEDMLDGVSLATILPGPVAVNVVAYVGYKLRGIPGAIVTASAVIFPSFLLVLGLSYVYFSWGEIPAVTQFFLGFIPAVAAIIIATVWNMGRKTVTCISEAVIAVLAFAIIVVVGGFYSTITVIVIAGLVGLFLFRNEGGYKTKIAEKNKASISNKKGDKSTKGKTLYSSAVLPLASVVAPLMSLDFIMVGKLLVTFAGMSVLLFGGGFVFIPAGTPHSFANNSTRVMKLLEFTTPGGFADYLRDLSTAVEPGQDMDPAIVSEVMHRHDTFPVT